MAKSITDNLQTHLDGFVTTLASCLHITRVDGVEYFFCTHDVGFIFDGDAYTPLGGYIPSSVITSSGYSIDQLELELAINAVGLTEEVIIAGLLDFATFEVFDVNYESLGDGPITQRTGVLGQYSHGDPQVTLELRGLIQYLHQRIGGLLMKRCGADLGDTRCGVNLAGFTVTGTVSSFSDRQSFAVTSAPTAVGGLLTWTSGLNNGLKMEVQSISGLNLVLVLPMPFNIAVSDAYSVFRGCDKNISTCDTIFSNITRHRGVPFLPGNDEIFRYPDAR